MQKKISLTLLIFISVFMLNVSAMAFQQRYDRREEDQESDPFMIEMTDLHVFKFLKNTWFYEVPDKIKILDKTKIFINDELGFGNQYEIKFETFNTCQLKFVLINYIGFYTQRTFERTYYMEC
ncbi:MAG: hypothetical protein K8R74_12365 [Bacteroidales bacterium]|nr:hypothetical protein [Bacteroidales bacterium]